MKMAYEQRNGSVCIISKQQQIANVAAWRQAASGGSKHRHRRGSGGEAAYQQHGVMTRQTQQRSHDSIRRALRAQQARTRWQRAQRGMANIEIAAA